MSRFNRILLIACLLCFCLPYMVSADAASPSVAVTVPWATSSPGQDVSHYYVLNEGRSVLFDSGEAVPGLSYGLTVPFDSFAEDGTYIIDFFVNVIPNLSSPSSFTPSSEFMLSRGITDYGFDGQHQLNRSQWRELGVEGIYSAAVNYNGLTGYVTSETLNGGSSQRSYQIHVTLFYPSDTELSNIFIPFNLASLTVGQYNLHMFQPAVVRVLDATSSTDIVSAISSSGTTTQAAISSAAQSIVAGQTAASSSTNSIVDTKVQQVREELEGLREDLPDAVESGTENALESFLDKKKQEVVDGIQDNVDQLIDSLPGAEEEASIISAITGVFQAISYNGTDCSFVVGACDLDILDTSFHLWDEWQINLSDYLSNDVFLELLWCLRFVAYFGLVRWCWDWIEQIIGAIINVDHSMSDYNSKVSDGTLG